jgi:hypothetical protein
METTNNYALERAKERAKREEEAARWYELNYYNLVELNVKAKILRTVRNDMTVGQFEGMMENFKRFMNEQIKTLSQDYLNVIAKKEFPHIEITVSQRQPDY